MTNPTEHDADALARALYHLSAMRRDLQRFAGGEHAVAGLMVLSAVQRIGPARISDVAAAVDVTLSVASRHVQALQDDGHVDRVPDPQDGRASLVAVTDAGVSKLETAHQRVVDAIHGAVGDWGRDEVATLADGIVRLHGALSGCDAAHHRRAHPASDTDAAPGPHPAPGATHPKDGRTAAAASTLRAAPRARTTSQEPLR